MSITVLSDTTPACVVADWFTDAGLMAWVSCVEASTVVAIAPQYHPDEVSPRLIASLFLDEEWRWVVYDQYGQIIAGDNELEKGVAALRRLGKN